MVIAPRYSCTLCPRTDLLLQDMAESGRVRKRDGRPAASWCRECNARKHREAYPRRRKRIRKSHAADYRFRRRVNPEGERRKDRERVARRRAREPERQAEMERERQRRYRAKLYADAERHELRKYRLRLAHRQREIAKGRDPASIKTIAKPPRTGKRVPVEGLRQAFERSGLTPAQLAHRLGWYDHRGVADGTRVLRRLGLRKAYDRSGGRWTQQVNAGTAEELAVALGAAPRDVGC